MNNKTLSIKTIVAIGIGAAVFMILGRFGAIPTGVPNTNVETAYAFLALMAILYGPVAGVFYTSDGNQKTTKKSAIKIW